MTTFIWPTRPFKAKAWKGKKTHKEWLHICSILKLIMTHDYNEYYNLVLYCIASLEHHWYWFFSRWVILLFCTTALLWTGHTSQNHSGGEVGVIYGGGLGQTPWSGQHPSHTELRIMSSQISYTSKHGDSMAPLGSLWQCWNTSG